MLGRGTMHGPNIAEFSHYEAGMDPFANFLFAFDAADKLTGAVINLSTTGQCGNPDFSCLSADFWNEVCGVLRANYGEIDILPQCAAAARRQMTTGMIAGKGSRSLFLHLAA